MSRIDIVKKDSRIKILLRIAKKEGVKVRFVNSPIYGWAFGAYDESAKVAEVSIRNPVGHFFPVADIAFILAHEIRHHIHRKKGLFKNYYSRKIRDLYIKKGIRSEQHFMESYAAELDCDSVARSVIEDLFPGHKSYLMRRKYPTWRVHPSVLPGRLHKKRAKIDRFYRIKRLCRKYSIKTNSLVISVLIGSK